MDRSGPDCATDLGEQIRATLHSEAAAEKFFRRLFGLATFQPIPPSECFISEAGTSVIKSKLFYSEGFSSTQACLPMYISTQRLVIRHV